jgi:glycosyltransferase involved in cell wall biosynthesis
VINFPDPTRSAQVNRDAAPTLGFLCGSPRISTRMDAPISGPRSHILGVIAAFEAENWQVKRYILGDLLPASYQRSLPENAVNNSLVRTAAADVARCAIRPIIERKAREHIGNATWVYERLTSFQALGRQFKRRGIPWVIETNAPLHLEAKTERKSIAFASLARRVELNAYRDCDAIVCISNALKDAITAEGRVPASKVLVVPNGVDTEFFNPSQHVPHRLTSLFTVGFVGGLYGWQSLDLLLEAISELRVEGIEMAATIVGDGLMRSAWEGRSRAMGLESHVTFAGQVRWPEVPGYIAGFDVGYSGQTVLGLGSMYHSPLKLYEYQAMGKAVVAAAFDDSSRLLATAGRGYLFTPASKQELKKALRAAFEQRHTLTSRAQEIRKAVVQQHSWRARVTPMIGAIRELLQDPASGNRGSLDTRPLSVPNFVGAAKLEASCA